MATHPLEPLSSSEIATTVSLLRAGNYIASTSRVACILLKEPRKEFIFAWKQGDKFPRVVEATLFDNAKNLCSKVVVNLVSHTVESNREIPGVQPLITVDEMEECEAAVKADPRFAAKLKEQYGDNPTAAIENVTCDIWSAGYYGPQDGDEGTRLARVMVFFKDPSNGNPYAYPVEGIRPVVDLNSMTVRRIEEHDKWPLPPPHFAHFQANRMEGQMRTDIKPLEITQKDGPSFKTAGNAVDWQKWSFVVGFNAKEGLTMHDVRFLGRPILYRAAISDMVVPYGDPAPQQARKNAFDVSDYGIGYCTNSLKLGCDCLGDIKYFDGELVTSRGEGWTVKNAVCMHEEDYGILWKHWDRHSNSNEIRRSRRLVVSTFATVENYDYGFYWYLYQDGNIQMEVKLTGFLSTGTLLASDTSPKYGNLVAPQIYGPNHQHFFNFRLDFAIDGVQNTVSQVDVVPEKQGPKNPYNNGFYAQKTPFEGELVARTNVNTTTSRTWDICNERKTNFVGMPVAYRLIPGENSVAMANPDAWWRKRARFCDYHLWVTPYSDDEFCCAGEFPNQNSADQGLIKWTEQNRPIRNKDCVVWYTFGVTHVPRPEDYPVMPTVYTGFMLKPFGFFDRNPAWDVPPQCEINKTSEQSTDTKSKI